MRRLECAPAEALGCYLAHTTRTPGGLLAKGRCLQSKEIRRLQQAGLSQVEVMALDPEDIHEDRAAALLARSLRDSGLDRDRGHQGRCNLVARHRGLLQLDEELVHRLNEVHESVTLATLAPGSLVEAGQVVATVKITPFAIDRALARRWLRTLGAAGGPLRLHGFQPRAVSLLITQKGPGESADTRLEQLTARRLAYYGCLLTEVRYCRHEATEIAAALARLQGRSQLILVAGASATLDRQDVVPRALTGAGGEVVHFGLPVEPGNLLLYGRLGEVDLINLPGCAKSPALNGLDLLLPRIAAGLAIDTRALTRLGVGGLIRGQARDFSHQSLRALSSSSAHGPAATPQPPQVAALVLAAGRSSRMGRNKLLIPHHGRPMIHHALDALAGVSLHSITLVTGFQAERLHPALDSHPLRERLALRHNPHYAEGLAGSLRCGLAGLPAGIDGVLVLLGDMPQIAPGLIQQLLERFAALGGEKIVIPTYRGQAGNPRILPARLLPLMQLARGDKGAGFLTRHNPHWVETLEVDDPAVLKDFDTPEALQQWR